MKELKRWMPMFWSEYLADTRHLTTAEHGAYLLLIAHYWMTGSVPWGNERQLQQITGLKGQNWLRSSEVLRSFFDDTGRHSRIDKELSYAIEKSKRLSANAKLRHSNGRATADTPTPTPTLRKKRLPAAEPPEFADFWASIPHREGNNPRFPALQAYIRAIKNGADPMQINAAAKKWNAETERIDKFVKTAVAWLNARMYEDYHRENQA